MKLFFLVASALLSLAAAQPSGGGDCDAANYFWASKKIIQINIFKLEPSFAGNRTRRATYASRPSAAGWSTTTWATAGSTSTTYISLLYSKNSFELIEILFVKARDDAPQVDLPPLQEVLPWRDGRRLHRRLGVERGGDGRGEVNEMN